MLSIEELQARFSSNEWPDVIAYRPATPNACELEMHIGPGIHWFDGHFPDQPVLAGVVQTHWAGEFAQTLFPIESGFSRIDNLKFQSVILPDQALNLSLHFDEDKQSVAFRYTNTGTVFSSGKLIFQQDKKAI